MRLEYLIAISPIAFSLVVPCRVMTYVLLVYIDDLVITMVMLAVDDESGGEM